MDWSGVVADGLTGLSLVAILVIGKVTIKTTREATTATTEATAATKASVEATALAAAATERSALASEKMLEAAQLATRLAERDARIRRLEGVLDVIVEMREVFNRQMGPRKTSERPQADQLERLAVSRKLEGRLVFFEADADKLKAAGGLPRADWSSSSLEGAIEEVKVLIRAEAAAG